MGPRVALMAGAIRAVGACRRRPSVVGARVLSEGDPSCARRAGQTPVTTCVSSVVVAPVRSSGLRRICARYWASLPQRQRLWWPGRPLRWTCSPGHGARVAGAIHALWRRRRAL